MADALTYEIFIATVALNLVSPNEYISFVPLILSNQCSIQVIYQPPMCQAGRDAWIQNRVWHWRYISRDDPA